MKWSDFLTAIPMVEGNIYAKRDAWTDRIIEEKPWITFGVTIYSEGDRKLLYLMDFLRIDEVISEFIREFKFFMPINIENFVKNSIKERWK